MKIYAASPIYSKVVSGDHSFLHPILSYKSSVWIQGPFRRKEKIINKLVIDKNGRFLTGFIPKIKQFCDKHNRPLEIKWGFDHHTHIVPPSLPEITLHNYQHKALTEALNCSRGIIHSPTGSGKTIIAGALISSFPKENIIFIVHTKDLLKQTLDEFEKWFPNEVGVIGSGKLDPNRITVGMIQTLNRLSPTDFDKIPTVVIVDEAHHVSGFGKSYAKVLERLINAAHRFGLTATLGYLPEAQLAAEGHLGPVIAEVQMDELIDLGFLAEPKLRLIKIARNPHFRNIQKYPELYQAAIVENKVRNKRILECAKEYLEKGLSSLILTVRIEHGHILESMAENQFPELKLKYIHGGSEDEDREEVRKGLVSGEIKVAIATTIFNEGVNIPSLGAVINAAGGKSEIAILQKIGRGLRVTDEKKEIHLVDFFDPSHRFLIEHFGERLILYFDRGWIK
jgi:superfamily II DNA or RNA helicase